MKTILLTNGWPCFVDDADYEELSQYRWTPSIVEAAMYATAFVDDKETGRRKQRTMHSLLTGAKSPNAADHLNSIGTCNFRSNLEVVTREENSARQIPKAWHSIHRGIEPVADGWRAFYKHRSETLDLGTFKRETEAALAYDRMAREFHGDFSIVNFPNEWQVLNIPYYSLRLEVYRRRPIRLIPMTLQDRLGRTAPRHKLRKWNEEDKLP